MIKRPYHEKAGHSTGGHADLFWCIWVPCGCGHSLPYDCPKSATCDLKPEPKITQVSWTGYNDANWWEKVAPLEQTRIRKMKCGRTFEINFETREVFEYIYPDFTSITTKELVDELERRVDPEKQECDHGAITVHGFSRGEEGVIVKYVPYGQMGLDKKPKTLQYGIYDARILVVID